MKVLFVGVFSPNSTNISLAEGFDRLGCEVCWYDYRARASALGRSQRDEELCSEILDGKPDLTVFAKCNQMSSQPVIVASQVGKSCVWYMDPLNGNFSIELVAKLKAATFSCFALQEPRIAGEEYASRAYWVPEGYDEKVDQPHELDKVHDVSFIGNPRGSRATLCASVGAKIIKDAFGDGHAKAVSQSKINLNFTEGGTSDRSYKVMAAGGFLLTERWSRMEEDQKFIPGEHLAVFDGVRDFQEKVYYYLEHPELRYRIASVGADAARRFTRTYWASELLRLAGA